MQPQVSVVIPVFNSAQTICRALDSVYSQDFKDFEVIVVDNQSTDESMRIIREFHENIKVFENSIQGAGPTRNLGVSKSRGKFIAFLDADDTWLPNKLSKQMEFHKNQSNQRIISGTYANFVGSSSKKIGTSPRTINDFEANRNLIKGGMMPAPLSTWILPTLVFEEIGGFNPEYLYSQDLEFIMRAATKGIELRILREVLCNYFLQYSSETSSHYLEQYLSASHIVKKHQNGSKISVDDFIYENSSRKSRLFYKALAGQNFRYSIVDFSSKQYFRSFFRALVSFILDPKRFLIKFLTQSNFFRHS